MRHVSFHLLSLELQHLGPSSLLIGVKIESVRRLVHINRVAVPRLRLFDGVVAKQLVRVLGLERQLVEIALDLLRRRH